MILMRQNEIFPTCYEKFKILFSEKKIPYNFRFFGPKIQINFQSDLDLQIKIGKIRLKDLVEIYKTVFYTFFHFRKKNHLKWQNEISDQNFKVPPHEFSAENFRPQKRHFLQQVFRNFLNQKRRIFGSTLLRALLRPS